MARLYPPTISGTIPAFYNKNISIPFTMNRTVSKSEISGFSLKVKNTNGTTILTLTSSASSQTKDSEVKFTLSKTQYETYFSDEARGQFFKVQLAYLDQNGNPGYYSSIGVIKYTYKPLVYIDNLSQGDLNANLYNYVGVYSQKETQSDGTVAYYDTTEKLYSSRFYFYNNLKELLTDSGDILHNVAEDVSSYESRTSYILTDILDEELCYYLQYEITTINKLVIKSPMYRIKQMENIPPEIEVTFTATNNFEDGCIDLKFEEPYTTLTGNIILTRYSDQDQTWRELKRFSFLGDYSENWSFQDYTTEQGVTYTYAIQQYNKYGFYSSRIKADPVLSDFEDMYICDKNHRLKVRFNPKVSTYKTDLLEAKLDTIGGRFPFFFKNGNTRYKELAISGLMSYQMDNIESFVDVYEDTSYRTKTPQNMMDGWYYEGNFYKKKPKFREVSYKVQNGNKDEYVTIKKIIMVGDVNLDNKINTEDLSGEQNNSLSWDAVADNSTHGIGFYYNQKDSGFKTITKSNKDKTNVAKDISKYAADLNDDKIVDSTDRDLLDTLIKQNYVIQPTINQLYRDKSTNNIYKWNGEKYVLVTDYDTTFYRATNLTSDNIYLERIFKNKVLDWLQDGKPKMFKSATEGAFIVRLMNVTATPTDQLGRMLHTFNCTAYEMAEFNFDNLVYYDIIDTSFTQKEIFREETIVLRDYYGLESSEEYVEVFADRIKDPCYSARILDMLPGTIVKINDFPIVIGATGAYQYMNMSQQITSIKIKNTEAYPIFGIGTATIRCITTCTEILGFDLYKSITLTDVPVYQFIGTTDPTINETEEESALDDMLTYITDIRTLFGYKYFLKLKRRECLNVYANLSDGKTMEDYISNVDSWLTDCAKQDIYGINSFDTTDLCPTSLYRIRKIYPLDITNGEYSPYTIGTELEGYYIDAQGNLELAPYTGYYYDPKLNKILKETPDLFTGIIEQWYFDDTIETDEGQYISRSYTVREDEDVIIEKANNIYSIKLNNGVIATLSYSRQVNDYSLEETNLLVKDAYKNWQQMITLNNINTEESREAVKSAYKTFLKELELAIRYYNLVNGISYSSSYDRNSYLKQYFDKYDTNYKMSIADAVIYEKRLEERRLEQLKEDWENNQTIEESSISDELTQLQQFQRDIIEAENDSLYTVVDAVDLSDEELIDSASDEDQADEDSGILDVKEFVLYKNEDSEA